MAGQKQFRVEMPGNRGTVLNADRCGVVGGHLILVDVNESGEERVIAQFAPGGWLNFIERLEVADGD